MTNTFHLYDRIYQLYKYHRSSLVSDIPQLKDTLKDDHLSMSLGFFSLPLGTGTNGRGPPYYMVIRANMHMTVPGIEPRSQFHKGT